MLRNNFGNSSSLKGISSTLQLNQNMVKGKLYNHRMFGSDATTPDGYQLANRAVYPSFITSQNMAGLLKGEGTVIAEINAIGIMEGSILGESTFIPNAEMGFNLQSVLSGEGTLSADCFAVGNMASDLDAGARPSAYDIAQEIWGSKSAQYNGPSTMGEKVNASGSASNPWTEVIESGLSAKDVLKLILAVTAGQTEITDLGSGIATVKFKSVDGTKDRLTASMVGSKRTVVTKDIS